MKTTIDSQLKTETILIEDFNMALRFQCGISLWSEAVFKNENVVHQLKVLNENSRILANL